MISPSKLFYIVSLSYFIGILPAFTTCSEFFQAIRESSPNLVFQYSYDQQGKLSACIDDLKQNALHIFAQYCKDKDVFSMLKFLARVDLNGEDTNNQTPLIHAAQSGNIQAAYFFLTSHGGRVDVNHQDNKGRTPLFYAVSKQNLTMTKLLLKFGADLKIPDQNMVRPIDIIWGIVCPKLSIESQDTHIELRKHAIN